MESVNEIKEALSARSRTATLEELRSEGRKRVRLIRAEHVASMISEAVHSAVEQSGLVGPEEVKNLVDRSRQEFRTILREREKEAQKAQDVAARLEEREREVTELRSRCEALAAELEAHKGGGTPSRPQLAAGAASGAAASAAAAPSSEVLMQLVKEMTNLKVNMQQNQGQPAGAPADFSAAIEKLTGSLNDRLERLGKKMGVSGAVESDAPVDFGGLFRDADKVLESNMDNIEVKQKAGGGIAANLARLKKLKGGS